RSEGGAFGTTPHLHVAAGEAGATALVRPGPIGSGEKIRVLFAAPLPRQLCWPRHGRRTCHQTPHARGSSPTQDGVLGRYDLPHAAPVVTPETPCPGCHWQSSSCVSGAISREYPPEHCASRAFAAARRPSVSRDSSASGRRP